MADTPIGLESRTRREVIDEIYNVELLRCMDIIERDDFYGIVGHAGLKAFGETLGLGPESRVLDLGAGIGGPARLFARTWGCKVTAVDLSAFNCQVARERTSQAGLDHLVDVVQGDALDTPFPDGCFSHVFGCEAWCYFPDKLPLYQAAFRVLEPGGVIAFLEAACEAPVRMRTEDLLGLIRYESVGRYAAMLRETGFDAVRQVDTTALATKDVSNALYRLVTRRSQIVDVVGEEVYVALLELWAEFLAYFSEGVLTHCGITAVKT